MISSLFEKSVDYQNMKNLNQSLTNEAPAKPAEPTKSYTNLDLWNKLNTTSINNQNVNETPKVGLTESELDKKYGITNFNAKTEDAPVEMKPTVPVSSNLRSNIKVDDAEIPPFLRRKFNK